jgi:5-methylcytosine-specific restriction endonuclease McrA
MDIPSLAERLNVAWADIPEPRDVESAPPGLRPVRRARYVETVPPRAASARRPVPDQSLRARVGRRDEHRCQLRLLCDGSKVLTGWDLTLDHTIPRSKGGPTTMENLKVACAPCNQRKADKILPG